jgi:hypothetical protein
VRLPYGAEVVGIDAAVTWRPLGCVIKETLPRLPVIKESGGWTTEPLGKVTGGGILKRIAGFCVGSEVSMAAKVVDPVLSE